MQYTDFVCLANSRKSSGRCVAGIRLSGDWIRPVSAEPNGTLYPAHYQFRDGSEPAVFDIVRLEGTPRPELHQPENWLIGPAPWQRIGRLLPSDTSALLGHHTVQGPDLLGNRWNSVPYQDFAEHPGQASLCLIQPTEIDWYAKFPHGRNRQVRARFKLAGHKYDLPITDLAWENSFGDGPAPTEETFFTVSLANPYPRDCYKVVAAVIVL